MSGHKFSIKCSAGADRNGQCHYSL